MSIYWVNLQVTFRKPMSIIEQHTDTFDGSVDGFLQEVGCTADSEEDAKKVIVDQLGSIPWLDLSESEIAFNRIGLISESDLTSEVYSDPDIRDSLIADPLVNGIWYISGRAFFAERIVESDFFQVRVDEIPRC